MTDAFTIDINNQGLNEKFANLILVSSDLRPVMRAISEKILDAVKENFETEGSRLGEKWQDLSPKTKKRRAKKRYDGKMLRVKSKLYNSLSAYADQTSAVVGTNKIYARTHQLGDSGRNIPARPYLGLNDDDMDGISKIISDALFNAFFK